MQQTVPRAAEPLNLPPAREAGQDVGARRHRKPAKRAARVIGLPRSPWEGTALGTVDTSLPARSGNGPRQARPGAVSCLAGGAAAAQECDDPAPRHNLRYSQSLSPPKPRP